MNSLIKCRLGGALNAQVNYLVTGQALKSLSRSKTSLGVSGASAKALVQQKPKGLSIRSTSELNVATNSRLNSSGQNAGHKQQECLKPKLTQLDNCGCPLSPRKQLAAKV